jgi:hypothetical protein
MSKDSERNAELNAKISAIQSKTAVDTQQALDFAHTVRVAQGEVKDRHGT